MRAGADGYGVQAVIQGWIWLIFASVAIDIATQHRWGWAAFFGFAFIGWCFGRVADEIEELRESLERDDE